MDYTPGAMVNSEKGLFTPRFPRPMSQGTRCHQLAMYVVFESPLQMLADSPSHYAREPEIMELLSAVPTVWDETHALGASIGEHVLLARRRGDEWYLAAMTNWEPRKLDAALDFLPEGKFRMDVWRDGVNAHRYASDYARDTQTVSASDSVEIALAAGGGWVARLTPAN
jgi:alpha-glucosidase